MADALRFDHDRMVGESYKDYAARMAGQARAAEIDRDQAGAELARVRAAVTALADELDRLGFTGFRNGAQVAARLRETLGVAPGS